MWKICCDGYVWCEISVWFSFCCVDCLVVCWLCLFWNVCRNLLFGCLVFWCDSLCYGLGREIVVGGYRFVLCVIVWIWLIVLIWIWIDISLVCIVNGCWWMLLVLVGIDCLCLDVLCSNCWCGCCLCRCCLFWFVWVCVVGIFGVVVCVGVCWCGLGCFCWVLLVVILSNVLCVSWLWCWIFFCVVLVWLLCRLVCWEGCIVWLCVVFSCNFCVCGWYGLIVGWFCFCGGSWIVSVWVWIWMVFCLGGLVVVFVWLNWCCVSVWLVVL